MGSKDLKVSETEVSGRQLRLGKDLRTEGKRYNGKLSL